MEDLLYKKRQLELVTLLKTFVSYSKLLAESSLTMAFLLKFAEVIHQLRRAKEFNEFVKGSEVYKDIVKKLGEALEEEIVRGMRKGELRGDPLREALGARTKVIKRTNQGNVLREVLI